MTYVSLTIRDYFAAQAMQGMCANGQGPNSHWGHDWRQVAPFAYELADAMMEERKKINETHTVRPGE